jgi:hypothetical protein
MAAKGIRTVWSQNEVLALIDIWKAEDIEAQLENVHRQRMTLTSHACKRNSSSRS